MIKLRETLGIYQRGMYICQTAKFGTVHIYNTTAAHTYKTSTYCISSVQKKYCIILHKTDKARNVLTSYRIRNGISVCLEKYVQIHKSRSVSQQTKILDLTMCTNEYSEAKMYTG